MGCTRVDFNHGLQPRNAAQAGTYNPNMLIVARESRELSVEQAATEMGVTVKMLLALERGELLPGPSVHSAPPSAYGPIALRAEYMPDLLDVADTDAFYARFTATYDYPRAFLTLNVGEGGPQPGWMCGGPDLEPCPFCGAASVALCDWPMGNGVTCDTVMCDDCRSPQPDIGHDIDYCPHHAQLVAETIAARRDRA